MNNCQLNCNKIDSKYISYYQAFSLTLQVYRMHTNLKVFNLEQNDSNSSTKEYYPSKVTCLTWCMLHSICDLGLMAAIRLMETTNFKLNYNFSVNTIYIRTWALKLNRSKATINRKQIHNAWNIIDFSYKRHK